MTSAFRLGVGTFLVVLVHLGALQSLRVSASSPPANYGLWSYLGLRKAGPRQSQAPPVSYRRHQSDLPSRVKHRDGKDHISRMIHQSWKTDKVDPSVKPWQDSWKEKNPEWTYILWTDEMNRKLVERHYPWFLDTYDNFPEPAAGILRADSVRYMYLHHFGGVYADLDFRALRPMEELYFGTQPMVLIGTISNDTAWDNNTPNAWMASSVPGHPFWLLCLAELMKMAAVLQCSGPECFTMYRVEMTTGPMLLYKVIQDWQSKGEHPKYALQLLRPGLIYPIDWRYMYSKDSVCYKWYRKEEKECYEKFPEAYAITYWSHIWDIHHRDNDPDDEEE